MRFDYKAYQAIHDADEAAAAAQQPNVEAAVEPIDEKPEEPTETETTEEGGINDNAGNGESTT